MFVYVILNKANGKVYVGQTQRTVEKRWTQHRYHAFHPSSSEYDTYFYRAIRKHGADAFEPITLREVSTKKELDQEERRFIALYQSHRPYLGYNGTLGGDGGIPNEQTRRKISAANKQYHTTPAARAKQARQGDYLRGKNRSAEEKAAISAGQLGRVISDETRRLIAKANTGRVRSDATKKLISERSIAMWANPEFRQKYSDSRKGKRTGPRPQCVGRKISAAKQSKLRGKETELKIVRCLAGLSYSQIADIYSVSMSAAHQACRDFGTHSAEKQQWYGGLVLTTMEDLVLDDRPNPVPVTAFHLPIKDQTCSQVL